MSFLKIKIDENLLPELISMNRYTCMFLQDLLLLCKEKNIDVLTPIAHWLDEGKSISSIELSKKRFIRKVLY